MSKIAAAILMSVLIGCTSQQIHDGATFANQLLDLRIQYDSAAAAIDTVIDELPTETGLQLLQLKEDADAYVQRITAAWRTAPGPTLDQVQRYYQEGRALYLRGYRLISPQLEALPPDTASAIVALHSRAQAVDEMVKTMMEQSAETRRMIAAGMELAALALRIGVMTL